MKINMATSEYYPYYYVGDYSEIGDEIEVSEETLKRWKRIKEEFVEMQNEIFDLLENQN